MEFHREVVVLLPKSKSGKIILCKRGKEKQPFPDVWVCAVGGGMEKGETPEEAILRETQEEIGADVNVKKISEVEFLSPERNEKLIIFTTKEHLETENLKLDEKEIQYLKEFHEEEILKMIEENPDEFAPTFIKVFKEFPGRACACHAHFHKSPRIGVVRSLCVYCRTLERAPTNANT